ncbi:hypothetical protein [Phenylobacterium sp. J367]|uniref:hypothetical protein n=1 Tax=Phenylobacterium sp. J367 TaxID=2898435 RepID=UPI0021509B46|nr:hypothetical protein [Phenylobacterium sp. J367]MCR5877814.1 hypothetical protein [Phenylobacterium sp. J367]
MPGSERDRLLAQVHESYPAIAPDLLEPILRFMTVGRSITGGDTDKITILLVVAVRSTQHPDFATFTTEELKAGRVPVLPSLGINIRSIADSTGMPRESVRRKVSELVEAGWLVKHGNQIHYTATAYMQVEPARSALEDMAVRFHEVVRKLADKGS